MKPLARTKEFDLPTIKTQFHITEPKMPINTHKSITPAILYLGTPVLLNSTVNENGSYNLAPISSCINLGWRCLLGFEAVSKTPQNILRTGECVINLPSDDQVDAVNRLSLLTGSNPVPPGKKLRGYEFEQNKFERAGLTPIPSETVVAPRVMECPIQLETKLANVHRIMADEYNYSQHERSRECTLEGILCLEMRVTKVHAHPSIIMDGCPNRIDPNRWKPLIMSFQRYYGLGEEIKSSRLAAIPESQYRSPDIDRAEQESTRLDKHLLRG